MPAPNDAELQNELTALRQRLNEVMQALAATQPIIAALEHERTLLRTLIDLVPDTMYAKDANGRKLLANRADLEYMNVQTETEAIGKTDAEIFPLEHARISQQHDQAVLEQGQAVLNREEQILVQGEKRWLLTSKVPLRDAAGQVVGLVGVGRDITERKRVEEERLTLERQLFEAQKLESLGVLAGGLAHDFNNLLVPILGNAALIRLSLPPDSPLAEAAQQIETAAQHAGGLARQMLAYSGKGRFITQPLDLNALVREMSQLLQASVPKNVALQLDLLPKLPAVNGDLTQLRQVVLNLIINASEAFAGRAGHIQLITRVAQLTHEQLTKTYHATGLPEGEYVLLSVTDDGPGMSPEIQARIFDPFFTTKTTGRGLGLAAVQGIIRSHQGILSVNSTVGQGTTFTIILPATQAPPPLPVDPPVAAENNSWRGQGAVLVIDDEVSVRATTARLLQHFGFTPLTAPNGPLGLEMLQANQPNVVVVLLDLTMPEMNGHQIYDEIRRVAPNLPVVMMSGYSEQELVTREATGLAGFLQKPFSPPGLQKVLQQALQRSP